jgi:hypothetical protein
MAPVFTDSWSALLQDPILIRRHKEDYQFFESHAAMCLITKRDREHLLFPNSFIAIYSRGLRVAIYEAVVWSRIGQKWKKFSVVIVDKGTSNIQRHGLSPSPFRILVTAIRDFKFVVS